MDARCPRCSTVFTTDRSGIQFCPNCGQQVDVPEPGQASGGWGQSPGPGPAGGGGFGAGRFTGEPPPGGGPLPGHRELTPWERRKELGLVQGFFETWKRSMFSPQQFFPTVRPDVPWTEALFYAWIIHGITVVLGLPFIGLGLFRPGLPSNFGGDTAQVESMMRAMSGGVGVAWALGTLLLYPLVVLAGAGIVHLCAMLFGAAKNGYGATVRALCYAQGPNLFGIVPASGSSPGSTAWSSTSSASPASRRRAPARPPVSCSCPSSSSSAAAGSSASSSPPPSPGWSAGWPAAAAPRSREPMTLDWTPRERRFTVLHALGLSGVMGLLVARFVPVARLPFWHCVLPRAHRLALPRMRPDPRRRRARPPRAWGPPSSSNPLGALVGCLLAGAALLGLLQWVFRLSLPVPRLSFAEARAGRAAVVAAVLANYAFVIVQTRLGWR